MADLDVQHKSHGMGLHQEQLTGRTQQVFFSPAAEDNFLYPESFDVDYDNIAEFDAGEMEISAINLKIRALMRAGHGHIVVKNPLAKHSLGVDDVLVVEVLNHSLSFLAGS